MSQLSEICKKSESKIRSIINHWLSIVPPYRRNDYESRYLVFDGSYIWKRAISAVILLDALRRKLIVGRYGLKEGSLPALLELLVELKEADLYPKSITIDGNPAVIKAFRIVWPEIIVQRCLVHIQRQGLMWCRTNPKTIEARKLRLLFKDVTNIDSKDQRDRFLDSVSTWESRYGTAIGAKPESGWVFSDLKRARSMLLKALPDMFHYLEDRNIPRTTNLAEGYFSFMKSRYRDHRGLSPKKRQKYFEWFFFLKP